MPHSVCPAPRPADHGGNYGHIGQCHSRAFTLITGETARDIKNAGFTYVGISLDGIGEINDQFRGVGGAFDRAVRGFKACVGVGQRVGLRLTLTRHNFANVHGIFDFIEREQIDRACFYQLVYSGRGGQIASDDLSREETRQALDVILARTEDFHRRGLKKEILTVDNHVDGVYLYMKLLGQGSGASRTGSQAAHVERRWHVQLGGGNRRH